MPGYRSGTYSHNTGILVTHSGVPVCGIRRKSYRTAPFGTPSGTASASSFAAGYDANGRLPGDPGSPAGCSCTADGGIRLSAQHHGPTYAVWGKSRAVVLRSGIWPFSHKCESGLLCVFAWPGVWLCLFQNGTAALYRSAAYFGQRSQYHSAANAAYESGQLSFTGHDGKVSFFISLNRTRSNAPDPLHGRFVYPFTLWRCNICFWSSGA